MMTEFVIFSGVLAVLIVGLYVLLSSIAEDKAEVKQEKAVNATIKKANAAKSSPAKRDSVRKKYTRK
jgi:uncharacterized protein (UPF0333 family)